MKIYSQRPPLRVALVGLGRAMFEDHYPFFRDHRALFDVVAACDLIKERRDLVARDFPGCKMFRRVSDLLYERDLDLVDIATCSGDHVKHAVASLNQGFWTLLESPAALSEDDAQLLRGAAMRARRRLLVLQRGAFAPDFLLARQVAGDPRLGQLHQVRLRKEDFIRRDDWQTVKRLGGGAAYYAMPDLVVQALKLLPLPPVQMWSELKRLASLGDAEDYVHLCLKTREQVTADVEFSGGALPGERACSFELRGDRGVFSVAPGATVGQLTFLDPKQALPRRRSSVRTPPMNDMHEQVNVLTETVELERGVQYGLAAFWKCVYDTVRTAAPFPLAFEDSLEAVKFSCLMKKASPFGR